MSPFTHRFHRVLWSPAGIIACLLLAGCQEASLTGPWRTAPSSVCFKGDGRPVLTYRFGDVPFKPYVERLYTPSGINVLRDAPYDHLHHHGLMFAVEVDGADFWGETPKDGKQTGSAPQVVRSDTIQGLNRTVLSHDLQWYAMEAKSPSVEEARRIEAYRGKDLNASLITWRSELRAPADRASVSLGGRPYFGLGMRFVPTMDKGDDFFNAEGKTGFKDTNDIKSRWLAYSAKAVDKPVTIAVFDHPRNPRFPAVWFTMNDPFSYISITPGLHHETMTLKRGEPLTFRYGVALWDGRPQADEVEKLYRRWVAMVED